MEKNSTIYKVRSHSKLTKEKSEVTIIRCIETTILAYLVTLAIPCIATTLQGNATHLDQLSPLETNLRNGSTFSDSLVLPDSADIWIPIPGWISGKWEVISNYQLDSVNKRTRTRDKEIILVEQSETQRFGWQKDSQGGLWTTAFSVEPTTVSKGKTKEIKVRKIKSASTNIDTNNFILKTSETIIVVDSKKRTIEETIRKERFIRYQLIEPDLMVATTDEQLYDEEGNPIVHTKNLVSFRKQRDFQVTNFYNNRDLATSFSKYLTKVGKLSLIPGVEKKEKY